METTRTTVLLAEDEQPVRQYLAELLDKNGFGVVQAADGEEAIRLYDAERERLHIIVSDLRMPNADGTALAKYNYENRFLPFVVCTGLVDAKLALALLNFGVQDYAVKPIDEENFITVVSNSAQRRCLNTFYEDDANPYAGNIGSITVPSRLAEINRVNRWVENKLKIPSTEFVRFAAFLREFLLNAHEHGNLKITEEEKTRLINEGRLLEELVTKEAATQAKIKVDLSVLTNEVAICITDSGYGFNFHKYLSMPEQELMDRLEMPNGRGIYMASKYFDTVSYSKGGASVLLTKKLNSA
ncbi:MAG: response regulator [Nitrospinae bacterium]|nr:response regulator [Nitrospinota bacterium]